MSLSLIECQVRDIIADVAQCPQSATVPGASLECDLGADVLDLVEIAMALESAFDVVIHDDDIDAWKKVGDVVDYIKTACPLGSSEDDS